MPGGADEIRQIEPEDEELAEEWLRETDEPELRGVNVTRWPEGEWPWQVGIYVAEFVREEPFESEMVTAVEQALVGVAGVQDIAREDREVWIVRGTPTGYDLTAAAAAAVDSLADRFRTQYFND